MNTQMYCVGGDDCAERQHAAALCEKQQLGVVRGNRGIGKETGRGVRYACSDCGNV